jgi:Mg-chelatase subunit ChlD
LIARAASYLNYAKVCHTCFAGDLVRGRSGGAASAQSGRQRPEPTPPPEDTPVRIETEEIKVNILAYDEQGAFVPNVAAEDIVITEDDILHQATSVRRMPASVLIVMDTGGELRSQKTLDQTRAAAMALVAALRPEDQVAVLQYADTAEIIGEWTTDRSAAMAAIRRAKFGRRSDLIGALRLGRDVLMAEGVDNRHMVLISDGTDSMANSLERRNAFRQLLQTDISVHVLSYTRMEIVDIEPRTKRLSNQPPPKAMPDEVAAQLPNGVRDIATAPKIGPTINMDRKHLETMRNRKADLESAEAQFLEITANTNGTIIIPLDGEEMIQKAAQVARLIDGAYVLTYTPKIPFSEKQGERSITVTSKRPGLIIEAKRKLLVPAR